MPPASKMPAQKPGLAASLCLGSCSAVPFGVKYLCELLNSLHQENRFPGGEERMTRQSERTNKSLRRFYTMGEVEAITSLSRATIYRKMAQGTFPASVLISEGRVGWERGAVEEWCQQRMAPRRAQGE